MYFADARWWEWHKDRPDFQAFEGQRCTIQNSGSQVDDPDVHVLRNAGQDGLAKDNDSLTTGMNSGYQALGIALAAGAARVVLLGYDMRFDGEKSHWHGGHPIKVGEPMYSVSYAGCFKKLQVPKGVEVINATPGGLLKGLFRSLSIEEALQ